MKDEDKTQEQLMDELVELRQCIVELEASEAKHKQVEEALRDTNELLEKIFATPHLLIAYMDTNFNFIRVNRAYAAADDREPESFVGKNHFDLYPNKENEAIFRRVAETGEPYTIYAKPFEYAEHPERGVTYWDWTLHPAKDTFGRVEGLILCLVNVTERAEAEEELKKYHDRLEKLVEERTAELTRINEELQQEVAERKRAEAERERLFTDLRHRSTQLHTAAEVSKSASTILDPAELMSQIVNLIQECFAFYYVGIFLIDETGEYAVLRAGTGEAGRKMLDAGHKLAVGGESMIGWCVANAQARIALDIGQEAVRFDNPLLPKTRSEMALPLVSRGRCIGALTVQSTEEAAFSEEDIAVLQTMADQVATAIENARLYDAAQLEIAERKQAQEALRKSEKKYRQLLETLHEGIWVIDKDAYTTFVNPRMAEMLGYTVEEMQRKHLFSFMDERGVEIAKRNLERREQGITEQHDFEFLRKDGTRVYTLLETSPITDDDGNYLGAIAGVQDITERKRAEEQLQRYAVELERSNRELQQFAYVASHDLQEPLRTVMSYLQLLEQHYGRALDANANEFIGRAIGGATRMQTMIKDLLAYSQVGIWGVEFEPTDCEAVLDRTLSDLQVAIEESGAVVTRDPLPTVIADELQLGQVFQNLIGNAIKFRSEEPPHVHVSARQERDEWLFSVRDNGIGIDPEQTDLIFEIFQRLHTWEEYPGTGIGLAICKKIVERHGGRIWVESQPGEGATFYFTIPMREGRARKLAKSGSPS